MNKKRKYVLTDDMVSKLEYISQRHNETPMELLRLAIQSMYLSLPASHQNEIKKRV